ncbi:MAG: hypothetical protein ACRDJL_05175 [Actinomycetota bacterium]
MRSSDTVSRGAQTALFALIGLCFALPFVSVSCASEEVAEGFNVPQEDQNLTGVQLVTGGAERKGFDPGGAVGPADPDDELVLDIPPEPFAQIAFAATLVGLCLVFRRKPGPRLRGATIAGVVGAASLLLLTMSPSLRALGLTAVSPLAGFWLALGLFLVAAGAHALQLRAATGDAEKERRRAGG